MSEHCEKIQICHLLDGTYTIRVRATSPDHTQPPANHDVAQLGRSPGNAYYARHRPGSSSRLSSICSPDQRSLCSILYMSCCLAVHATRANGKRVETVVFRRRMLCSQPQGQRQGTHRDEIHPYVCVRHDCFPIGGTDLNLRREADRICKLRRRCGEFAS